MYDKGMLRCAAVIVIFAVEVFPQQSVPYAVTSPSHRSVLISATSKGEALNDLSAADIEIKVDGKPVKILHVVRLGRLPLQYCVLFDTSRSQSDDFKTQQGVAIGLLQQIVQPGLDRGWVNLFSVLGEESKETQNPNEIAAIIATARAEGSTALYDAVAQSSRRFGQAPQAEELRLMLLFSDGDENQSHVTSNVALEAATAANVHIYAIGPNQGHEKGVWLLKKFAETTGGRLFTPARPRDFGKVAGAITDDLRNMFEVTYTSEVETPKDCPKSLEIKSARKGITILSPKRSY